MAYRKSYPISYEWATALNLIDVVFSDCPKVLDRWHKYFDNLHETTTQALQSRTHKYLELMSAMAKELRFANLEQTDIDKFYIAEAHGVQANLNAEMQKEWLRVLKATARFETIPIPQSPPAESSLPPEDLTKFLKDYPPKPNP